LSANSSGLGFGFADGVGEAFASMIFFGVGLGFGLIVGLGVGLAVGFGVGFGVGLGVTFTIGVGVALGVDVALGFGVGSWISLLAEVNTGRSSSVSSLGAGLGSGADVTALSGFGADPPRVALEPPSPAPPFIHTMLWALALLLSRFQRINP
jgi:hypothetical protein